MSERNWAREGKLAARLAELGCPEVEIETTYLKQDRDGTRVLNLDEMNTPWAEAEKKNEKYAHRWGVGASVDEQFFVECFVGDGAGAGPSMTKQSIGMTRYGAAFMREKADFYDAKLGSDKPGRDPNASADDDKPDTKGHKNPFSPNYKGSDAQSERIRIITKMGTKVASGLAAAAGTDLAGRPLKRTA
jgi:hypothetical protein